MAARKIAQIVMENSQKYQMVGTLKINRIKLFKLPTKESDVSIALRDIKPGYCTPRGSQDSA